MVYDLQQIAGRIRELRDILEIPAEDAAKRAGISLEEYLAYENGTADIPISILYEVSSVLGVDPTVLLTGDEPRMDDVTVVRGGNGVAVERYEGYGFVSLAYNYKGRDMEPMLVTILPMEKPPELVSHGGQEFNYVVEGTIGVVVGHREYRLSAGDCIYFNPRILHGQKAIGGPAKFITIINDFKK